MTTSSIPTDAQVADVESKRKTLSAELKSVNDRADAETDRTKKVNLLERAGNVIKGIDRLDEQLAAFTKARTDDLIAGVAEGRYGIESGDGSDIPAGFNFVRGGIKTARTPFVESVMSSGFNLKAKPSVEVDGFATMKAQTLPSVTDWNRSAPGLVPLGTDRRFLFPFLPMDRPQNDASIQDFRQTARTLTGTVQRTLNATTDKADLATTTTLVNTALAQFAVTLDDIPNAVLESVPSLAAWLASEGEFQVRKAIDAHVMAQIVAATPAFGEVGTVIPVQVRNAIGAMRAVGAEPRIAVLNPTDSVTLDTYQESDGAFLFGTNATNGGSPLFGLQVVERAGAGDEDPFLIDPGMLGVLYMGDIRFDADPYTGFKKNLTTLRVEVNALFHVRNIQGAYRIAAA